MDKIEEVLSSGGAVVLPTETVYGLFCKALDEQAVSHVYDLKDRPREKALNLNVSSLEEIYQFSKHQPQYFKKLYQANEQVPIWVNSGMKTIGFRVPSHPKTLDLIRKFGPLIGPSANLSGKSSGVNFQQIMTDFNHEVLGIEDDAFLTGQDSTILDLSGETAYILRQGAVTCEEILAKIPEIHF